MIYGNDMIISVTRMMTMSTHPPKYPASIPSTTPIVVARSVLSTPTVSETRVP